MTKTATSLPQVYKVLNYGQLPDGERFIEVSCLNYDGYVRLPDGMDFEGRVYTRTGWNSDTQVAYYKAGAAYAVAR